MNRLNQTSLLKAMLAAVLLATLNACAPLIVGGAVMSGMVAVDRRTTGIQLEDETIELRSASRIRDAMGSRVRVGVISYNRQVLLVGETPNLQDKQRVEQIVGAVENVRAVVNELLVQDSPTLVQRSSDTLVTGKVKAAMVDDKDLQVNAFKVVTERGTVYLMGRVTQAEANRATEVTRSVSDVKRVVRILEIISEEEMKRLQLQAAQPAKK